MNSLRYALRSLLKTPGYTFVALVTLALGIGVNTSMFSVVDTLLFRTAPYPEADRLVLLSYRTNNGEMRSFSDQEIREIRPQAEGFSSLTTVGFLGQALAEPGRPAERLRGIAFSREMMDTFRVQPMLGRAFTDEEFEPGKNQVILLSESFWLARYGGSRDVIGRTVRLDGESVTIVGVMPGSFDYRMYWGNIGYWRPLNFTKDQSLYRAYRAFQLIGRLKPGVSPEMIGSQLAPVAATQSKNFPLDYPELRYRTILLHKAAMDDVGRTISWMLLGLSGFVLLIACANLANLQLARATAALREFAIRAALGASRGRLIAQQLTECIVLSMGGGILGYIVALWVNRLLERNIHIDGTTGLSIQISSGILAITFVVSVVTGSLFGIVPALFASRADVSSTLKAQTRGSTSGRGHRRMRNALVIGEIALALMLLGGAALMNRGFGRLLQRHVGWDTEHVLTAALPMSETRFDNGPKRLDLFRKLETRLQALPGVEHVALATSLPLYNYTSERQVFIDAPSSGNAQDPIAAHVMITSNYFAAMGIRILEGRTIPADIKADDPQYIVVNEALARQFWPGQSAVGKRLGSLDNGTNNSTTIWREVIGVVGDVEPAANIKNPSTRFTVYRPLVQEPWSFVNIVVRSQKPATLIESVRRAISEVDADMPADQAGTIRQFIDVTQHNLVVVAHLLVGFALLGLVLAAVGLYGLISHLVAQRTSEFGIRLALGAKPHDILRHVLGHGMQLAAVGTVVGLLGAYGIGRFLSSFMPRLVDSDPLSLVITSAALLVVTLVACWVPARNATRVDPMIALRAE